MTWTQATDQKIDLLIPERAYALSINDNGDVVGTNFRAFYKPNDGPPTMLPEIPGALNSAAWGINNDGVIVGENQLNAGTYFPIRAVRWPSSEVAPSDLGTLGGPNSHAYGLNQAGDVVGSAEVAGGSRHAFVWTPLSGMIDLTTWPNPCTGQSEARSVNDLGVIVGTCNSLPVYWTAAQGMRPLVVPPGITSASPMAINNRNQVVGNYHGFGGALWTITLPNSPPAVTSLSLPTGALTLGSAASVTATFSDPDAADTHTAAFSWGDGQTTTVAASPDGTSGSASASHVYADAGTYIVSVEVSDNRGASAVRSSAALGESIIVLAPGETRPGTSVAITPVDPATGTTPVTLTFASVVASGTTTVATSSTGAPPPLSFKLGTPPVYYELQTTATFSGSITICFAYSPSAFRNAGNLKLFHGGAQGAWTDVTTSNDVETGRICGSVTSLSPFVLAELRYDFAGFFQPVDNPGDAGVVNTLRAGAAVPVKFSLGGNLGLNVLGAGSPSSSSYTCGNATEDAVEETIPASANSFTYDAVARQYVFTWKTEKLWAGTCRRLTLTLKDGTSYHALFRLTR
jgi:probable HAF family extracellular repeat protein